MATATIDFAEQKQTEVEPYRDSPTENELSTMEDYRTILKPYFDAQENLDKAKGSFAAEFNGTMALQIAAFRDAYWTPKSHCTVSVNGVEMTWDDFVKTYFGVTRRWLNIVLKRYLAPTTTTSDDDTEDVDIDEGDDNNGESKAELLAYINRLDEDEATSLLGQINDGFNDDKEDDDEEEQAKATGDELDEIVSILKRIPVNSVSVFARKLELLAEKLGFDGHIRIVVD
jgi:hypothetical protein